MRSVAERNGIEVHGVLWVTDELESHGVASPLKLHDALRLLHNPLVFLPDDEVLHRIRHLAASLGKNFNALDDLAEEIPRPNIDGSRVAHKPHHIVLGTPNIELVNRLAQEFH